MVREKENANLAQVLWKDLGGGEQTCVSSLFHLSLYISLVVKWDQLWKEDIFPSSFSEADCF